MNMHELKAAMVSASEKDINLDKDIYIGVVNNDGTCSLAQKIVGACITNEGSFVILLPFDTPKVYPHRN